MVDDTAKFIGTIIVSIISGFVGMRVQKIRKRPQADAMQNLSERIDELKEQRETDKKEHEKELAEIRAERDIANEKYGKQSVEVERLTRRVNELEASIKQVENRAAAIATERDAEIRNSSKLATELAEERKITATQERRIVELERDVEKLKLDIAVRATVETMYNGMVEKLTTTGYRMVKVTEKIPTIESQP